MRYFQYRRGLAAIRKAGIWYVDIPRTSSSSIRTELSGCFGSIYGKADLIDSSFNVKRQLIDSHLTAREMRNQFGESLWSNLFTFSIVRNPWDRMLSIFQYRKAVRELAIQTSFAHYLDFFFKDPRNEESPYSYHGYYFQSIDYLTDEFGKIMVDYIGRYENRSKDFGIIRSKCNCSNLGELKIQESANKQSYRLHYSLESREKVAAICKKDIDAFGYTF